MIFSGTRLEAFTPIAGIRTPVGARPAAAPSVGAATGDWPLTGPQEPSASGFFVATGWDGAAAVGSGPAGCVPVGCARAGGGGPPAARAARPGPGGGARRRRRPRPGRRRRRRRAGPTRPPPSALAGPDPLAAGAAPASA